MRDVSCLESKDCLRGLSPRALCRNGMFFGISTWRTIRHYLNEFVFSFALTQSNCVVSGTVNHWFFPPTTLIRLYEFLMNSRLIVLSRSTPKQPAVQAALVLMGLSWAFWWRMTGSNRRPPACKAGALPAELIPHVALQKGDGGSGWSRTNDPRLIKTVL